MVALVTQQNPAPLGEKEEQFQDQDPYEAEETLSLCDLPRHSDSACWDDFSKDYQSSSFDRDEDNFFEFFSEEFTPSTYPAEKDIIFCGKLIPYNKEAPKFAAEKGHQKIKSQETGSNARSVNFSKKKGFFRSWRSYHFHKVTKPSKTAKTSKPESPTPTSYRKCEVNKVSILSKTPSKSKWYVLMFQMARLPSEMELKDIKNRQSRRSPSTMFRSFDEESDEMAGAKGTKGIKSDGNSTTKGLWGLLRAAVGCGSPHADAVVREGLLY
ncbi:hypothetical protein PS2_001126 [Malus domestica]